jgi:hypothetical protein
MALTKILKRLKDLPGVLKARHLAEVSVTPHLRGELAEVRASAAQTGNLTRHLVEHAATTDAQLASLHVAQPLVLNAITSTNGVARQARRELGELQRELADRALHMRELEAHLKSNVEGRLRGLEHQLERIDRLERWVVEREGEAQRLIELWRADLAPHVESLEFLLKRIEMVRAEVMNEIRYGQRGSTADAEPFLSRVVRPEALAGETLKLNLGCGHVPIDGYVNVDMRDLPGVDLVAKLDELPIDPGSVDEVFSAHVLEHFPREELIRQMLPYWVTLLRPGGSFRAVVPDIDAMAKAYATGTFDFVQFREVVYGGQEYEGDTHFNGFSPDDLVDVLTGAGLTNVAIVERGRTNGACLEVEVAGIRPAE